MVELGVVLLVCLGLGHVLDRSLFGDPGCGPVERFGRALAFGLAATGAASMALDMARLPVGPTGVGAGVVALAAAALLAGRRRARVATPPAEAPRSRGEWITLALLAAFAIVALALVVRSGYVRPAFQFDSITRWMFKTKVLVLEGTLRGAISTDPDLWFTHQRYPPLVSHVSALPHWVARALDPTAVFDDRIASSIYPWYAVALACLVYGAVARRAGRLVGAFAATWIATLPGIAFLSWPPPGSGAFSALADIPLATFALAAGVAALDAVERRRDRAHLELALLLAAVTLTKNEGLPMVAAFTAGVWLASRRGRWRAALGPAAFAVAAYVALWGAFAATIPGLDENYWERLSLQAVRDGLRRVPMILQAFGSGMLDFRQWNITWLAVVLLVSIGWAARPRPGARLLLTVVGLQLLFYGFAYMVTQWTSARAEWVLGESGLEDPLVVLFGLTLGRLLMHVAPLAIVLATITAPLRPAERPAAPG